jgi:magnesium transporter
MQIVEFTADSLRFADSVPAQAPADGFVWIFLDREEFESSLPQLQQAAQQLGGSALLDLHCQDLGNAAHPSHYDYTSVYDLVIFRRLATQTRNPGRTEHEAPLPPTTARAAAPRASAPRGPARVQPHQLARGGICSV